MITVRWKDYQHVANAYKTYDSLGMSLNAAQMWDDLREQFSAYPDGHGGMYFESDLGHTLFLLKYGYTDQGNNDNYY